MEVKLGTVLAQQRVLPVVPELAGLFPEGGLRRGSTVTVGPAGQPGTTSLALRLLAGAGAAGSWCAVVGAPDLGLVAASQLGAELERLALVPQPGRQWLVVMGALLEGFDVVALRPPASVAPTDARKLEARARERGAALLVFDGPWPGVADMRLSVVVKSWEGLGAGHGYLSGALLEVGAQGRRAASRARRCQVSLPGDSPGGPGAGALPKRVLKKEPQAISSARS